MRKSFNFVGVTPAGSRPPFFPRGFHIGVIADATDFTKAGDESPSSFQVTVAAHKEWAARNPECDPNAAGREFVQYADNGYTLAFLSAVLKRPVEDLQRGDFDFDPTDPVNGLRGKVVYIEAIPQGRADRTDPNKHYDVLKFYSEEEWTKARAKYMETQATATAAAAAASSLDIGGRPAVAQAPAPAAAAPAPAPAPTMNAGIPGLGALPSLPGLG